MSVWILSNLEKYRCIENDIWNHPNHKQPILRATCWKRGVFSCESDDKPEIDLQGNNGFSIYDNEYDFSTSYLENGDLTFFWPDDMNEEDRSLLEKLWDEEGYDGWEKKGLTFFDNEIILYGDLKLYKETDNE